MADGGGRGEVVAAKGVAMVAEGVGARGEGGRRLVSGRQPFCSTATSSGSLLFPPPPPPPQPPPSLPSSSHPPASLGTSLHALVVSFVLSLSLSLVFPVSLEGATCSLLLACLIPSSSRVPCFRSARLNAVSRATLRSIFVSFFAFARFPRTLFRDLAPEDRRRVYTRVLPIFARSKHST